MKKYHSIIGIFLSFIALLCCSTSIAQPPSPEMKDSVNSGALILNKLSPDQSEISLNNNPVRKLIIPKELPPWRNRTPHIYTSMLTTIMVANDVLLELSESDKQIISTAKNLISSLDSRAGLHLNTICLEVNFTNVYDDVLNARDLANRFRQADKIQEDDAVDFFYELVASLSEEGGELLVDYMEKVAEHNKTANHMDWIKFAEHDPVQMLERVKADCEHFGRPK